jgi:hypothetical protein
MFSNSAEAKRWWDCNCFVCTKYESGSQNREKAKCKTAFDIDLGHITGELPARAERIIEKSVCPFRSIANPESKGFCKKCEHYSFVDHLMGAKVNINYCEKHRKRTFSVYGCRFFKEAESE